MAFNRKTPHKIIEDFCESLGVKFGEMVKAIKPLLQHYYMGISAEGNIKELVSVDTDKKAVRRKFIDMVKMPYKFKEIDRTVLAVAVACSSWFKGKSNMLLEEMKKKVPNGKELVDILNCAYLEEDGITDLAMMKKLHMSPGTFDRRKKDAIALYGALLLEYAINREKEDIAAGIIDPPEYKL